MDVNKKFSELARLIIEQKKLEDEVEAKKEEIKKYMERRNLSELLGDEHKAIYKSIVQERVDSKRLKEERPRIAKQYTIETTYMRFNFS